MYIDEVYMAGSRIRRAQLDRFFDRSEEVLKYSMPKKGWIKEIREALGMSMNDLAERLNTQKQRIERMERDEVYGKVKVDTLRKVAEAMNCELVYFIVPKSSLQETIEKQARMTATEIASHVDTAMKLEMQGIPVTSHEQMIEDLTHQLVFDNDRRIWKSK